MVAGGPVTVPWHSRPAADGRWQHPLPTTGTVVTPVPTVPAAGTDIAGLFPPAAAAQLRAWAARHQLDLTATGHTAVRPSPTRLHPGNWRAVDEPAGRCAIDPELTSALTADLPVRTTTPDYRLPSVAAAAAATVLAGHAGRTLFDGAKLSLWDVTEDAVLVRHASYLDGIVTNFSAHAIDTPVGVWDAAAHAARPDGAVAAIGACGTLSNHLGGAILAVTGDGRLLLTRQPSRSAYAAGLLTTTAAGSFDTEDLTEVGFAQLSQTALERELEEEAGISAGQASYHPLGAVRDLSRAGKPDVLLFATLPAGTRYGAGDRDGEVQVSLPADGPAAAAALRQVAARADASLPLSAACLLAADALETGQLPWPGRLAA